MTLPDGSTLSPLAAEIERLVLQSPGKRVIADELLRGASRFDPGLIGDPVARSRLRDALDELQTAGRITFPAASSRIGWDTRVLPSIPSWVTRVDGRPPPRPARPPHVWPSALEAAARIASRTDEYELLERVGGWMRDNPEPDLVPIQERSLDLLDDEKALDACLKTRLFTSGALTLDLLACFIPPVPFVSQHLGGTGRTRLLVVENLATYTSFLKALDKDIVPRPDLHLAWGGGNSFTQSVLSILTLRPAPTRVYYFGDLDLAGLQIALNAAAQAEAARLPSLLPAEPCYRFLLDGPRHWRRLDGTSRLATPDYDTLCGWLPATLRPRLMGLLQARQRVPQERLGIQALRENPQVLAELLQSAEATGGRERSRLRRD
jgi:Uncharacterized protein conserved in bacteria C-term(DUF2220)